MERTIEEWLNTIADPTIRERALENRRNDKTADNYKPKSLYEAIYSAFDWSETPQSDDYWEKTHEKALTGTLETRELPIPKRTIESITENEVVNVRTEAEDLAFRKMLHEAGKKWCTKENYIGSNRAYEAYGPLACYWVSMGEFAGVEFYAEKGKTILPATDFLPDGWDKEEEGKEEEEVGREEEGGDVYPRGTKAIPPQGNIDSVTADRIKTAINALGIAEMNSVYMTDIVRLLYFKGGQTSLQDIEELKAKWEASK